MHNYHDSFGRFAPGTISRSGGSFGGPEWPYLIHFLLPNLDQGPMYNVLATNWGRPGPWIDPAQWPAALQVGIPALQCASDGQGGIVKTAGTAVMLPTTNYMGFFSGLNDGQTAADATTTRTAFGVNRGASIRDINDGTSNTMLMAEYLTGTNGEWRGWFYTNRAGAQYLHATNGPNSPTPDNLLDYPYACTAAFNLPLQNLPCVPDGNTANNFSTSRSRHVGGVHALMGDGAVRFVSANINLSTWRNLAWISDGLVIGDF